MARSSPGRSDGARRRSRPGRQRPSARASPRRAGSTPTAKKILAAARRILTERGYQGLTLQAISAEAGVNKAGVWYYFGGKEQLVLALLEEIAVTDRTTSAPGRRRTRRSTSASTSSWAAPIR